MIARKAAKKSGRRQEVKAGQVNTLPPKLKVKPLELKTIFTRYAKRTVCNVRFEAKILAKFLFKAKIMNTFVVLFALI